MFHLTDRLGLLQAALEAGDAAEAQVLASRLASLSEQVGLADFARVARDLAACLAAGDAIATAAVGAAAAAARRGFALLGHALRRSIRPVACRAPRLESPARPPTQAFADAAGPRARPPGGSAASWSRRTGWPPGSERQDPATRAWVAATGFAAGLGEVLCLPGAGRRRSPAALFGWGRPDGPGPRPLPARRGRGQAARRPLRADAGGRRARPGARGARLAARRLPLRPLPGRQGAAARARLPRGRRRRPRLERDRRRRGAGAGPDQHAGPRHGPGGARGGLRRARRAARRRGRG